MFVPTGARALDEQLIINKWFPNNMNRSVSFPLKDSKIIFIYRDLLSSSDHSKIEKITRMATFIKEKLKISDEPLSFTNIK